MKYTLKSTRVFLLSDMIDAGLHDQIAHTIKLSSKSVVDREALEHIQKLLKILNIEKCDKQLNDILHLKIYPIIVDVLPLKSQKINYIYNNKIVNQLIKIKEYAGRRTD